MKKIAVFFFCVVLHACCFVQAQTDYRKIDSLKAELNVSTSPDERIYLLAQIVNAIEFDSVLLFQYAQQAMMEAEQSRNPELMIKARWTMGKGYLQIGPVTESRINAATRYFEEALAISKKNQIDTLMVRSLWQLVSPYSIQGDLNKALNYANEAFQNLFFSP